MFIKLTKVNSKNLFYLKYVIKYIYIWGEGNLI